VTDPEIRRELRLLKGYALVTTLWLVTFARSTFRYGPAARIQPK
jgi:hypothetical protein